MNFPELLLSCLTKCPGTAAGHVLNRGDCLGAAELGLQLERQTNMKLSGFSAGEIVSNLMKNNFMDKIVNWVQIW